MGYEAARIKDLIRDIPDFPKPGVVFKDVTPLLADAEGLAGCTDALADRFAHAGIDKVIGVEARGFIIAAPVAYRLGAGFVPVRKQGKLPFKVYSDTYELEYGTDTLEMHKDAVSNGARVLIVDAQVIGFGCILELGFLGGRKRLEGVDVVALVSYE